MRDLVYSYICGGMKRAGAVPCKRSMIDGRPRIIHHDLKRSQVRRLGMTFANCAIMRTCRQVHQEFAATLYGQSLQILSRHAGHHTLALSHCYVGLVRDILFVLPDPPFDIHLVGQESMVSGTVQHVLQIANALANLFPGSRSLRIGFGPNPLRKTNIDPRNCVDWVCISPGSEEHPTRQEQVAAAGRVIRSIRGRRRAKQLQLEVFEVLRDVNDLTLRVEDTPLCEAFRIAWA